MCIASIAPNKPTEPRSVPRSHLGLDLAGTCVRGVQSWGKIDARAMERYLRRVCSEYLPNPYHNAAHAADVTQVQPALALLSASLYSLLRIHCFFSHSPAPTATGRSRAARTTGNTPPGAQAMAIMLHMDARGRLSPLERLAVLLAACVHDLGHPGVSNSFLVESRSHWALVYNDISVNENMHASRAMTLAEEEGLFRRFTRDEYRQVRPVASDRVVQTKTAAPGEKNPRAVRHA